MQQIGLRINYYYKFLAGVFSPRPKHLIPWSYVMLYQFLNALVVGVNIVLLILCLLLIIVEYPCNHLRIPTALRKATYLTWSKCYIVRQTLRRLTVFLLLYQAVALGYDISVYCDLHVGAFYYI